MTGHFTGCLCFAPAGLERAVTTSCQLPLPGLGRLSWCDSGVKRERSLWDYLPSQQPCCYLSTLGSAFYLKVPQAARPVLCSWLHRESGGSKNGTERTESGNHYSWVLQGDANVNLVKYILSTSIGFLCNTSEPGGGERSKAVEKNQYSRTKPVHGTGAESDPVLK